MYESRFEHHLSWQQLCVIFSSLQVTTRIIRKTGHNYTSLKLFIQNFLPLVSSADNGEGKPVQITGGRRSVRGPSTRLCCVRFCLFSVVSLLSTVQINPNRPRPQSFCNWVSQSFRFSINISSQSVLSGGTKQFFSPGPNPLSAALLVKTLLYK
jgi:hypothetical protein